MRLIPQAGMPSILKKAENPASFDAGLRIKPFVVQGLLAVGNGYAALWIQGGFKGRSSRFCQQAFLPLFGAAFFSATGLVATTFCFMFL
jgi:hypothetical protein